jgi:hypothetical protein
MKVTQTNKLEFTVNTPPMISELEGMLAAALKHGFSRETPVYIRAGTDERDHDYTFYASIGTQDKEATP